MWYHNVIVYKKKSQKSVPLDTVIWQTVRILGVCVCVCDQGWVGGVGCDQSGEGVTRTEDYSPLDRGPQPPPSRYRQHGNTVNAWSVRILLKCILVGLYSVEIKGSAWTEIIFYAIHVDKKLLVRIFNNLQSAVYMYNFICW